MRQIGTLEKAQDAKRLADFLMTQGIAAHTEADKDLWSIWVREEDHLDRARDELENFKRMPDDPRYAGVASKAQSIREAEARRRDQARRNTIEMRNQWKGGAMSARRCPAVMALIAASILVGLFTQFKFDQDNDWYRRLQVRDPKSQLVTTTDGRLDPFTDIKRGQVWRVVTPIFLHGGALHLICNLFWMWLLGGQFEHLRGTLRLVLFVLGAAAVSMLAEVAIDPRVLAGGMSGVNYALFGYVWIRWQFAPEEGFQLSRFTALFMIAWFFYCFTLSGIANGAHAFGFAYGIALGYIPLMFRKS